MDNEIKKPLCFVIMGFGEKPDYPRNRTLNLDKSYENIIKPAATSAGYNCIRCDEIKHSGLIDDPMYRNLLEAELVIADISTLNANAMYELGIRHAIRPFSTIIISQEEENIPFDTNHILVFQYKHSGDDIGYTEAMRCQKELSDLIVSVTNNQNIDSPFYKSLGIKSLNELQIHKNSQPIAYTITDSKEIACLSLIGRWNDNEKYDRDIIKKTIGINDSDFLDFVSYSKEANSPLALNNFQWTLNRTPEILEVFCKYNNSDLLSKFKNTAIEVLSELDPKFELEKDKRFLAGLNGKKLKFSKDIRFGISETLVWLSINKEKLLNEQNKFLVDNIVYEVLNTNDWHLWASLNELLPILAEASPKSFIEALKEQITKYPDMIKDLFKQEGDGIISGNLMTGILWSLETIAWIPEQFQMVIIILAELAKLDIGGTYTNRPINSLKCILLPWINNTTATINSKMDAVKYLFDNYPELSWKIIFSLLPSMSSTSFGCREPKYRTSLLEGFNRDVLQKDYQKQISEYSNYVITLMKTDYKRIFTVLDNLNAINPDSYEELFDYLNNLNIEIIPENEKFSYWEKLVDLIKKHRRFINAKWSYHEEIIKKIESFANRLKPTDKRLLYHSLFSLSDYDLMDEAYDENKKTDWKKVREEALKKRETALNELIDEYGLEVIDEFITNNQMAISIAEILGNKKSEEIDKFIIPKYLNSKNEFLKLLCSSYIRGASYIREKNWFNHLDIDNFDETKKIEFLISMKFESDTWDLVNEILGADKLKYWKNINQNILACNSDFEIPVIMFNKVGRINEALECIHSSIFNKRPIDPKLMMETLSNTLESEPNDKLETYKLIEIIKFLENAVCDKEILWQIEWAFYGLFVFDNKDVPKTLYKKISTSPELYIEILKLGFKEDGDKTQKQLTKNEEALAQNAWNILNSFNLLPGIDENNNLNTEILKEWIEKTLELAEKEKRISSAKLFIGHLLFHTPSDKDGFWIDKTVARLLNDFSNSEMLKGYKTEVINSRGVYTVDTTGKTENALGDIWKKRADELRIINLPIFADKADSIANFYYEEAKRSQEMGTPPDRELI